MSVKTLIFAFCLGFLLMITIWGLPLIFHWDVERFVENLDAGDQLMVVEANKKINNYNKVREFYGLEPWPTVYFNPNREIENRLRVQILEGLKK